jgi:NADH-quinone oxidoreductase subunit L
VLELAGFLLLVGAVAKSAQLPLHTWLPDAMEGPTPVSALIHAATMVTAGVYLVGRFHVLYDATTYAHAAVAITGGATAFMAATIAVVQTDIKRVLAYSTMSQIGYMFLAVGIGAYAAGFFHLIAHAFFKALLFMAAGNVIHALNDEQDMRTYGGLWNQMRATAICFLVGALALAGIFPLVGFWSKDLILAAALTKPDQLALSLWVVAAVTALITAFYTGRMWWIAFGGDPSMRRGVEHPHEAPPVMLLPVAALATLTCAGGLLDPRALVPGGAFLERFLRPSVGAQRWEGGGIEYLAGLTVLFFAIAAFLAGYEVYVRGRWRTGSRTFPRLQRLLERKYYFDELYDAAFVRPLDRSAAGTERFLEEPVITGSATGIASAAEGAAGSLSLTQSGYFRSYVLVFAAGATVAAVILLLRAALG